MKVFKEETRTSTYKIETNRVCDMCGFQSKKSGWESGIYDINDVQILCQVYHEKGSSYPEGGSKTYYDIDLCPRCFKERLVPWLKSQGVEVREEESDW